MYLYLIYKGFTLKENVMISVQHAVNNEVGKVTNLCKFFFKSQIPSELYKSRNIYPENLL